MTLHRFHVPNVAPGTVVLPEVARIHAVRVIRLGVGDALSVFDAGVEFEATVSAIEKHRVLIEVGAQVAALSERGVALHLMMSPLKGDLTELVIQKATELGVAVITPVVFERTDTVARREPTEARMERWRRVAAGAAEQSGRTVVPDIRTVSDLETAIAVLGHAKGDEARVMATEPSIAEGTFDSAPQTRVPGVESVVVAVGPAGGLSPGDLAILRAAGFTPERFALHTLRSETACVAALAILGMRYR